MKYILLCSLLMAAGTSYAQNKTKTEGDGYAVPKQETASNVMLNASSDDGPRSINVGLPLGTKGTTVSENGLLVSFDSEAQKPSQAWRSDGSFSKVSSLSLLQTAIQYGEICASVASYTETGSNQLKGNVGFTTNSFGLLRGNLTLNGPIQKGWYYALNAFINLDPSNVRSDISRFLDKTYILKGSIKKTYNGGKDEMGIRVKYDNSQNVIDLKTPYFYRSDGTVDALPGLKIGDVAYSPRYSDFTYVDPLTGEKKTGNVMKESGAETFSVELFGKNAFNHGYNLNYVLRYNHANSGMYSPNFNDIINTSSYDPAATRFIYSDSQNQQVYTGYVQRGMGSIMPKSTKEAVQARVELTKNAAGHKMTLGLNPQYYRADHVNRATFSYLQEVANNPRQLILQNWNAETGAWVNASNADEKGQWKYNGSMQYYNGHETKVALYFTDNWDVSRKLNLEYGFRLENHSFSGDWYSAAMRADAPSSTWVSGNTEKVSRNFFNKNIYAILTYKIAKTWGLMAEGSYFEKGGHLSAYSGADDPKLKQSQTPYVAGGVYFNHPLISLISKVSKIEMNNIGVNGTFNNEETGESMKQTFNYDVKTIGWTTDAILKPFKGFNLHLLLTIQNPQYKKFEFEVYGKKFDYAGKTLRSISKTLIEIDPSYTWSKFKIWASARYFSKEAANYPNTIYFASRWETFAGFDYKYNKSINFSINAVNLLNQAGAQGTVSGGNTIMDGSKYYDKVLSGTYIRPFTVEFKTSVKF